MTSPSIEDMEKTVGFKELNTEQEFITMLSLDHAIIYISVDCSGPERISHYAVYKALNELGKKKVPVFKINCSLEENRYAEDWLIHQKGKVEKFCYGGYGETLFIERGKMLDFISNPGKDKPEYTKEKLNRWIDRCD